MRWGLWFLCIAAILIVGFAVPFLLANHRPPKFVSDSLWNENQNSSQAEREFTELLQKEFPQGTSETALKSRLSAEGFKAPSNSNTMCDKPVQIEPVGTISITCRYRANALEYHWGSGFGCSFTLLVRWNTDDSDEANADRHTTRVVGSYRPVCL